MIGKTLGHYEITSQLGKGGMGEVYQAKDQVLGRDVAIKVLPEEFARDADRVARFQREAKLLASLNHPNIATIHGLEEAGGTRFLVMELVEGETLADRIKRGLIPVEESLKLALQIAEALEAAHEKGVIHRDLKPANIKVMPEGKVKVLDFGLAKAFAGEQAELNLSNSPTLSDMATMQGVILGTAAYMPPEQARGKPVDKRADIWAFGCVLYEMLTGQAAFQGEDVTEILAAVVKLGANLHLLPANLHPRVREAINRCLQKEQKKRYRDIGEAHYEIEQALSDPGGFLVQPAAEAGTKTKLRQMLPWIAAAGVLTAIIAGAATWMLKPIEPKRVMRFDYELPAGQQFRDNNYVPSLAVSPDGKQIVYATAEGLYLRSVDEWTAKLIAGTEGGDWQPFFSPDGQSIGYFSSSDRQLKKIAINGGAPVNLCSVSAAIMAGASWSPDNTIVYGQVPGDIMRVSANGGTPESLVKAKSASSIYPHILPDGKSVLYTDSANVTHGIVMVRAGDSGEVKELFPGFSVGYLPTGHIIYGLPTDDNLYAIPFDLDAMEVQGGPVPIIEGVIGHGVQSAVSDAGTLVYIPGTSGRTAAGHLILVWVDRQGKEEPLAVEPNTYIFPKISPDGTKVALRVTTGVNQDIWIWDVVRKTMTRLTFHEANDSFPLWAPDGKRIAFFSNRSGKLGIYWKAADGTGTDELLVSGVGIGIYPRSWSGDAKSLVFMETVAGNMGISAISMEGDRVKKSMLQEKHGELDPRISPDGRWMAYACDESGKFEIYVRPYPEVNAGKWQVSTGGGGWPLWSPDGRELFYRNGDAFMAVSVKTDPAFSLETPGILFRGSYASPSNPFLGNWDIHPDGKRFLMVKPAASAGAGPAAPGPHKINIVLNWFEELKQKVPVK
jgi:eukaryotic-like serine/threonine-protein kinase